MSNDNFGIWISCKERLPEEDGLYLVTYDEKFVPDHIDDIDYYTTIGIKFYNTKLRNWGIWNECKVYAWMPLPKMYEEER